MAERHPASHPIPPVFDSRSRVLILGSFPSVFSREEGFFYAHPQNRFWRLLAVLFEADVPVTADEKKELLLSHKIALWDVAASCEVAGSSDGSIRAVQANDISPILRGSAVERIFLNGSTAAKLYERYIKHGCSLPAQRLPSTSAANAAWSFERLCEAWTVICGGSDPADCGELERVLLMHAEKYPLMRPEDAVKLIYQNEYGGEHIISDRVAALERLLVEYAATAQQADAPLCESIGGDIYRVALCALDANGITPAELFERFCASAERIRGSDIGFSRKLRLLERMTEENAFGFGVEALAGYLSAYRARGGGAVTHSETYREAYRPAYRLVLGEYMQSKP